MAQKRQWNRWK